MILKHTRQAFLSRSRWQNPFPRQALSSEVECQICRPKKFSSRHNSDLELGFRATSVTNVRWFSSSSLHADSKLNERFLTVQKFGGTSLGTWEKMKKVTNIIKSHHDPSRNKKVIAVVSAISSETKEKGTTTLLLQAAAAAVAQKNFGEYLDAIEGAHMDIVYTLLKDRNNRDRVRQFITKELNRTRTFCESLSVIRELSPRSHDMVIGCGERLSAGLVSACLREEGIESVNVDLSDAFTDGLNTEKRGYHRQAKEVLKEILAPHLESGVLPVVTGFFGSVNGGIVKGVGRGYTDLTAALCSGALQVESMQVWKESDGVFTGNPTKIENAKLLSVVTPSEASELTYFGNEVLHPFTMECAIEDNVPIAILNTFKPDSGGTCINETSLEELKSMRGQRCQGIAAVCSKKGITVINLMSNRMLDSSSFLSNVFQKFSEHKVKADLISTSVANLTVTLHESNLQESVDRLINDLGEYGRVNVETNRAIVTCIGAGMRNQRGLASKVFHCLSDADISLEMISQGASEINISVVIDSDDMDKAIHTIHAEFFD